jgi:hypothetical protein
VNGRNWEVINAIRLWKRLHKFAIGDLVSDSRVAKIEWWVIFPIIYGKIELNV